MAIFGLGDETKKPAAKTSVKKADKKATKPASSQGDEAKALLAKMDAKKDAGECPFC